MQDMEKRQRTTKKMKKQSLHHKNLAGMTNLIETTELKEID